jgi:hypothetical protein
MQINCFRNIMYGKRWIFIEKMYIIKKSSFVETLCTYVNLRPHHAQIDQIRANILE